jgi:hypothetical protein
VAEAGVVDRHRQDAVLGFTALRQQVDQLAGGELDRLGQVAGADLGTLHIHEQGDVAAGALTHLAHAPDHGAGPGVVGVRHVEATHVHAGQDELLEHLLVRRGRAQRENDLGEAVSFLRESGGGRIHPSLVAEGMPGRGWENTKQPSSKIGL